MNRRGLHTECPHPQPSWPRSDPAARHGRAPGPGPVAQPRPDLPGQQDHRQDRRRRGGSVTATATPRARWASGWSATRPTSSAISPARRAAAVLAADPSPRGSPASAPGDTTNGPGTALGLHRRLVAELDRRGRRHPADQRQVPGRHRKTPQPTQPRSRCGRATAPTTSAGTRPAAHWSTRTPAAAWTIPAATHQRHPARHLGLQRWYQPEIEPVLSGDDHAGGFPGRVG